MTDAVKVPLVEAARATRVPYPLAWKLCASGAVAAERTKMGRWLVAPRDLVRAVEAWTAAR